MDCRHHWCIAPAAGPVSRGVCRYCHEEREFRNSMSNRIVKWPKGEFERYRGYEHAAQGIEGVVPDYGAQNRRT